jgi:hypothetical protein
MKRPYLVGTCCCLLALPFTGCDFSGDDLPHVVDEPDTNNATTSIPETPAEIIDLTIPPAMLELQQQEKDFLAPTETPSTAFTSSSEENDASFNGKLHLDESEDKEYLDTIDGAEVNIKVKFE